jgi:hypothetical protein
MDVLIRLRRGDPPAGSVVALSRGRDRQRVEPSEVEFVGWLGLLRVLAEVTADMARTSDG